VSVSPRRASCGVWLAVVAAGLLGCQRAGAGEKLDYPPEARLMAMKLVAGPGERATAGRLAISASIVRGYDAVYFTIDPEDSSRGSRWVAYDTGQEKLTTLHSDVNTLCGQRTRKGTLGQRILAARLGPDTLLGTGPAAGEGSRPGGHVLRNGKDIGSLEPGWAVVAFDPAWVNRLRKDKSRRGRDELGYLALARSPDAKRFRIYHVDADKLEYLGIEGGAELEGFQGSREAVVFPAPDGTLMEKQVNSGDPPTPSRSKPKPSATKAPPEGVGPAQFAWWSQSGGWLRAFEQAKRMDILEAAHLHEGYACFARERADAKAPAELFLHRPSAGEPQKLCSLPRFEGRTLHLVHRVQFLRSQDVVVLAGDGEVTVLLRYEAPLLDTICAQWNALMDQAFKGKPVVPARHVGNLYDLAKHADRGMDPMLVASDGRPYFGTMPHHSTESGQAFSFDPKANKLLLLGSIDRMAGVRKAYTVPYMIHGSAFEMKGKVYFVAQDPHYGGYGFPITEGAERPRFQGSPIAEYDIQTDKSRGLGVPLPGDCGLFRVTGDPKHNILYVRRGYSHHFYGPITWLALQLDAQGNLAGRPKPLPFDAHPGHILVREDGIVVASVPDKAFLTYQERRKSRAKTDDLKPLCRIMAYDPASGKAEIKREVEGAWEIEWLPWQNGKASAIGRLGDHACRLDLASFALEKLWPWPAKLGGHSSAVALHGGRIYWIAREHEKGYPGTGRTAVFYSADVATGKVLQHGYVVDEAGRRPKDLNYFAFLRDGRIFACGTVFGLPTDEHYMARYRDSEPFRLDCAAFVIDKLPPGTPLEE